MLRHNLVLACLQFAYQQRGENPCVLKLAASSSRLLSSNRLRGLLADSISAATGTLRYSWLLTVLCVFDIFFSLLDFVGCRFVMDCADFWRHCET